MGDQSKSTVNNDPFNGETGDFIRALVLAKSIIAKSGDAGCIMEMHQKFGCLSAEDRQHAKTMYDKASSEKRRKWQLTVYGALSQVFGKACTPIFQATALCRSDCGGAVWEQLCERYQPNVKSVGLAKEQELSQLMERPIPDNELAVQLVYKEAEAFKNQLVMYGINVSEQTLVNKGINAMAKSGDHWLVHRSMLISLQVQKAKEGVEWPKDLSEFFEYILDIARRQGSSKPDSTTGQVNEGQAVNCGNSVAGKPATTVFSVGTYKGKNPQPFCKKCGERTDHTTLQHIQAESCKKGGKNENTSEHPRKRKHGPKCWTCGEMGHVSKVCQNKKSKKKKRPHSDDDEAEKDEDMGVGLVDCGIETL